MQGHIARPTDDHRLAVDSVVLGREHLGHEVGSTIARRLRTDEGTAPSGLLAGQDPGELVAQALVLAEHVADLPTAHADVAGGHVGVRADVAGQLRHETLTEAHHLGVGLALGIEIGSALSTAHGQRREAVLEDLLEAEEFQDAQVDARMEAQTTLVGADGGVEFHTVAPVDPDVALVVRPRYAEGDDALRLDHALEQGVTLILGIGFNEGNDGLCDLFNGLQEFRLVGIAAPGLCHERLDTVVFHDAIR